MNTKSPNTDTEPTIPPIIPVVDPAQDLTIRGAIITPSHPPQTDIHEALPSPVISETSNSFCAPNLHTHTGQKPEVDSAPASATDVTADRTPETNPKSETKKRTSRKMRRSSRPTGTPRAKSSRCSRAKTVSNTTPTRTSQNPPSSILNQRSRRSPRYKSTPFEPLPEFANLTPDHIDYLHDYIRHHTYEESIAFLRSTLNIEISLNRLYRYRSRLDLAEQLQITNDNAPAIENLLALLAGRSVDIDAAGMQVIKQRALALASRPDTAPSLLMNLFRIFTWEHRKTVNEHRMKSIDRREKCRERMTKVAEKRQKLAEKKFKKPSEAELARQHQEHSLIDILGDFPPTRHFHQPPMDPAFDPNLNSKPAPWDIHDHTTTSKPSTSDSISQNPITP